MKTKVLVGSCWLIVAAAFGAGCSKKVEPLEMSELGQPAAAASQAVVTPVAAGPKDPRACRQCRETETRCGTPEQVCGYLQGNAAAGPASGQSKQKLCLDAIACVERTDCAKYHTSQCYCGDLHIDECTAGKAAGPCRKELEAAFEVTTPNEIGLRYDKKEWAGGVAIDRADCLNFLCKAACN